MHSTPDQVTALFRESGYKPTKLGEEGEVSVCLPMISGGVLTVTVGWDQGPDAVFVGTNGVVVATHLPFVEFEDFRAMFRALLRGCVPGPIDYRPRVATAPVQARCVEILKFLRANPGGESLPGLVRQLGMSRGKTMNALNYLVPQRDVSATQQGRGCVVWYTIPAGSAPHQSPVK